MKNNSGRSKQQITIKNKGYSKSKWKTRIAVGVATILLVSFFAVSIVRDINAATTSFLKAKNSLLKGYQEAQRFDGDALKSFAGAKRHFTDVEQRLANSYLRTMVWIPVFGGNIDAINRLAACGSETSIAAMSLLEAADEFQGGGSLKIDYSKGKLNLDPFIKTLPYVKKARTHLLIAKAEEESISKRFLLPKIQKPLDEYSDRLAELEEVVDRADQALSILPEFFGENEGRRYFLAMQNNAELRATGGLIGNYGIITVDKGAFCLVDVDEIDNLSRKNRANATVSDDFRNRYDRYDGLRLLSNTNMSPDFPVVSSILLQAYKNVTGNQLDGIIAVDPIGLKYLLEAIGPVRIPGANVTIDAQNAVEWTLVEAYDAYQVRAERKDFLNEVAVEIWKKIIAGEFKDQALLLKKMTEALMTKHLILFSAKTNEQRYFEGLGYAGLLNETKDDYLQVVVQNHGANKVDVYLDQEIKYEVNIQPDGTILSTVMVTLKNNAPSKGLPIYVSGKHPQGAKNGANKAYLSIYVPGDSALVECVHDGQPGDPEVGQEKGKAIFSHCLYIPAGEQQTVSFTYENSSSLSFSNTSLVYSLDWQYQPVIRDPKIELKVNYPGKYKATSLSEGLSQKGSTIINEGTLHKDSIFSFKLNKKSGK